MTKKLLILFFVSFIACSLLWAAPEQAPVKVKAYNLPVRGSAGDPEINVPAAPEKPSRLSLDDYVGTLDTAGTT